MTETFADAVQWRRYLWQIREQDRSIEKLKQENRRLREVIRRAKVVCSTDDRAAYQSDPFAYQKLFNGLRVIIDSMPSEESA